MAARECGYHYSFEEPLKDDSKEDHYWGGRDARFTYGQSSERAEDVANRCHDVGGSST